MTIYDDSLELHRKLKGKLSVSPKMKVRSKRDLSLLYTPGVAEPCRRIASDPKLSYEYTGRGNTIAVVSDGSAVLGLGNIGAEAAMPVMEGKCLLFKEFGGIDAVPIVLRDQSVEGIVASVRGMAPSFGGINLEDISAPRCFDVEDQLQDIGIPVFHDDQHGTAIVVWAALLNSSKVVGKSLDDIKVVINGAGAAGYSIVQRICDFSGEDGFCRPFRDIIVCDSKGIIYRGRKDLNSYKQRIASGTDRTNKLGSLADAMVGADVFIGVSKGGVVTEEMVKSMADDAIVIAMANPEPEIVPVAAKNAGAAIVATGRSDFPNQVNNVLAFPGVFRGALDARAVRITDGMKNAAAFALASLVKKPTSTRILPSPLDKKVAGKVAEAVRIKAVEEGVVRP
ncbi:NAD-dependent malic enzyme [uncultured archaeon]|nr:NAD-dependent malic enzyme [uncultured archaeon]